MGRPLKIKNGLESGSPQTGGIDIGFNSFNGLESPVIPSGMSSSEFLGVVGGTNTVDSPAYPTITIRVKLDSAYTESDGYIITQKGSSKYLVAGLTTVNDEDMVVGKSYRILSVGTTNWEASGATGGNPQVGDIFTCTAVGAGTGTVQQVAVCSLANLADGALTAGTMTITLDEGDSTPVRVKRLSNKFALDFSTPSVRFAANFFDGGSTVTKSGAENNGTITTGLIENYNS